MKTSLRNTIIGVLIFFVFAVLYPDMSLPVTDTVQFIVILPVLIFIALIILEPLANVLNFSTK